MSHLSYRRVIEDGSGMAIEVVADVLTNTDPSELNGYVVIGLRSEGGFKIASNAKNDASEIWILEHVVADLKQALRGAS